MNKELRALVGLLIEQGFDVKVTSKNHYRVTREGQYVATLASTPSEYRGSRNAMSDLRKAGFEDPRRKRR